jgi:hypothetical protein
MRVERLRMLSLEGLEIAMVARVPVLFGSGWVVSWIV